MMMKNINWFFIVAGTLIMVYVMSATGRSLKTAATPGGILNLELAYNKAKVTRILKAWEPGGSNQTDNIRVAISNTWLDFIFLFFYSFFLFYTCKTIAESHKGLMYRFGKVLAIGALNAGLLDIAENAGMLISLNGFTSNSIALLTAICSVIKWTLALTALAYTVILGPLYLLKRNRHG